MKNKFHIVIPVYNEEALIGKCIESVLSQDYKKFSVVVVDDCSTDKTLDVVSRYMLDVDIISNSVHTGSSLAGLLEGASIASPDSILVVLDGDDYLYDNTVLSYLNSIYSEDIWLTYGQFTSLSGKLEKVCGPFSRVKMTDNKGFRIYVSLGTEEYRKSGLWFTSHLKTFRKWLFDKIDRNDLLNKDGEYFKTCCDVCVMFPMIEMAGIEHIRFIDKILYVYNDISNGYGSNVEENLSNFAFIRNKEPYEKLYID